MTFESAADMRGSAAPRSPAVLDHTTDVMDSAVILMLAVLTIHATDEARQEAKEAVFQGTASAFYRLNPSPTE